ncbi:MAG TPA: peptide chain release factor N(5)-glutamine methyltransferase [Terracidiphilus sp.]|nr:peptide chain release factor N(5)-glutamine methyltransferase [Terracidiphilus sp.]
MTLEECVRKGEALLRTGPHPGRARADAELLLRHLLQRDRAAVLARWKERLAEDEQAHYSELLKRRLTGEPVQYILGETEFHGLPLRVTRDVLIPRPETEHVVEKAAGLASRVAQPRIVDVGTGSGAIAIALAAALPAAQITAIDMSGPALEIAKENAARNHVADRIRFLRGDLLSPVAGECFDMVASNPPYVSRSEISTLEVEVRDFEPELALFAGDDGLAIYRRLIPAAHRSLVPGGALVLEIGYGQAEALCALLAENRFERVEFTADLQGIPRVVSSLRV